MSVEKIKAVYYPYTIMPERLLKQTLLYFDEITVCLPYYLDIPEEYKYLYENSLINIFKNPFLQNHQRKHHQEQQQELYRELLMELQEQQQKLHKELQKSPPKLSQEFQELPLRLQQEYQQEVQQRLLREYKQLFFTEKILPCETVLSRDFLITERVAAHFGLFKDSFCSGQIPFTDNPVAQEAFLNTFSDNVGSKENKALLAEVLREQKTGLLVKDIFKQHLQPLPGFELTSYQDILELKERLKDELESFRLEMRKLVHDIKCTPWEDGFEGEIIRTVDQKINPTVNELGKRRKTDNRILKLLRGIPLTSIILGLQSTSGITTSQSLQIVGSGVVETVIKYLLESKTKNQSEYNGLNLLVELKDELK